MTRTGIKTYSTSGKKGGTGLGTYSARLMAETQGGRVGMTTSERDGTMVEVVLPAPPVEDGVTARSGTAIGRRETTE